jgi:hypothetical protein
LIESSASIEIPVEHRESKEYHHDGDTMTMGNVGAEVIQQHAERELVDTAKN